MTQSENTNSPVNLDEFHFHEVVHTSHLLGMLIELAVQDHVAVAQTPELKTAAKAIQTAMQDFYQQVNKVSADKFENKPHIHGQEPSVYHKADCYDVLKAWFEEDGFHTAMLMENWDVVEFNLNSQISRAKGLNMYTGEPSDQKIVRNPMIPTTLLGPGESVSTVHQCPSCESFNVTESIQTHRFEYGTRPNSTELKMSVPVMTCTDCKEAWTDYRAAELEDHMIRTLFPRK